MQKAKKLLRIFGNPGKDTGSGSPIVDCAFDDDFSSWEFVVPSDDDDVVAYFFSDEDAVEIGMELDGSAGDFGLEQDLSCLLGSPSSGVSMESPSPDQITGLLDAASVALEDHGGESAYGSDYAIEEEDEGDDDDDYDVDDELVPYWARDKFAKQRMMKLDNMALLRMKKLKRLPYYCNKPGSAWKVR